jgi:hypothetical protein
MIDLDIEREGYVMPQDFEISVIEKSVKISSGTRIEIVDA